MTELQQIQEGDVVTRMLCGCIKMNIRVTDITDTRIICGAWEFDINTGYEIDELIDTPVSHLVI